MGVDYRSIAAIGQLLNQKDIVRKVQERGCLHELFPSMLQPNFCGVCGKPIYVVEEENIPELNDNILKSKGLMLLGNGTEGSFFVLTSVWAMSDSNRRGGGSEMGDLTDVGTLEIARKKVRECLEPLGLWRPNDFGLWSILYCSY